MTRDSATALQIKTPSLLNPWRLGVNCFGAVVAHAKSPNRKATQSFRNSRRLFVVRRIWFESRRDVCRKQPTRRPTKPINQLFAEVKPECLIFQQMPRNAARKSSMHPPAPL